MEQITNYVKPELIVVAIAFYGALNSEEFQKFIADQNEALEVVATLKKELL